GTRRACPALRALEAWCLHRACWLFEPHPSRGRHPLRRARATEPRRDRAGARRQRLVVDHHGGADMGPGPQPGAVFVGQAETAVTAGVTPGAAPVVVVETGAIAREVL